MKTQQQQHRSGEQTRPPRVLLARLSPVAAVGMRRWLSDEGVEIVGEEGRPLAVVALAREVDPDAVVLALGAASARTVAALAREADADVALPALTAGSARTLCDRIRLGAPSTTVIMWASEENLMWVSAPGEPVREVVGGMADLHRELIASQARHTEV